MRRVRNTLSWLLFCAGCATALAQTPSPSGLPPELLKQLNDLQNSRLKAPGGAEAKGWTCRDPEDGKRMHVVDTTNNARMNKVPSSVAGLHDNKTELARLPPCTRPG